MKRSTTVRVSLVSTVALFVALSGAAATQEIVGFMYVGEFETAVVSSPCHLTLNGSGGLYYATFATATTNAAVYYVADPLLNNASTTHVLVTSATEFPVSRGFQGVAVDSSGNLYVSGDTGSGNVMRKFGPPPALAQDVIFAPTNALRILGCDLLTDQILVATTFNTLRFFDTTSGDLLATVSGGINYQRDVAVNRATNDIFASHDGNYLDSSVSYWTGGSPSNLAGYTFVTADYVPDGGINAQYGVAVYGIHYNQTNNWLLVRHLSNPLSEADPETINIYEVTGAVPPPLEFEIQAPSGSPEGEFGTASDSVIWEDAGQTHLFVADQLKRRIVIFRATSVSGAANWQDYR